MNGLSGSRNQENMAMASVVKSILRNRKCPFIFALFLLLIFVTLFLISNSQSQILISSSGIGQPVGGGRDSSSQNSTANSRISTGSGAAASFDWKLCNASWMVDYIPCLDNWEAIKTLKKLERKERHCPNPRSRCLVPLPKGYKIPVPWPKSRDMIWYENVPHPKLVDYKKDQHWVVKSDDHLVFPGGGTQFKLGVNHYIESIEKILPIIEWGKHIRVLLDVGCGVASFGGYLLEKDVITMSFAPKDQHEAQIQFALERGIPATLSVIGTRRLVYPDNVYDMVHCARCRVRWDADGGKPLLELNRILRPGGFFIWSATPVYLKDEEHQNMWKDMVTLTEAICWKLVNKTFIDSLGIGVAIYQKPSSSSCYISRKENNPPICEQSRRPNNISWYVPLDGCLPLLPEVTPDIVSNWPAPWPRRLKNTPPSIFTESEENFSEDTKYWSSLVSGVYLGGLDINWSSIRNVMDMNAGYGGFAASIIDLPLWAMNVVPISEPDTLSVIFDRGLIGMYHDWCESFDTYPRTYDLLHANFLFNKLTQRCSLVDVVVEIDRVLRPGGVLLVQDTIETIKEITAILVSLHWSATTHQDKFLVGKKGFWRPNLVTRF